jgi:hypothetical protein
MRYVLATTGGADYFGNDLQGTLTWDYALAEINPPGAIEVPSACPAGLVSAPLLPDATDLVSVPGLLSYSTQTANSEAAGFYQQQLTALGWQPTTDRIPNADGVWLEFERDAQHLSVVIASLEQGSTIDIVLVKRQP